MATPVGVAMPPVRGRFDTDSVGASTHPTMEIPVTRDEFEEHVEAALESLPEEIATLMDNINVAVADRPTDKQVRQLNLPPGSTLLGLYVGVPLGRRGPGYTNVMPDTVLIFQETIEALYPRAEVVAAIRRTVLHEVGHHFGLSDARLRELGY